MINYQYLLEIDALTSGATPLTLRYCCQPGWTGLGSDGASHTWTPGIVDPGLMQIDLFTNGRTTGRSTYSYGEIVIGNQKNVTTLSGPADILKTYMFYGAPVRMYIGLQSDPFSNFTRAYTAAIESINKIGGDTVSFTLRGRQADLDIPFAQAEPNNKFLGTSVLPDGVEGQDDLKDKDKPILLGRCFNVAPVLVNSAKLIYAVSPWTGLANIEMGAELRVYDNGIQLYNGGTGKTLTQLLALAPGPGWFYASTEGYIRLGASPVGTITCDCAEYSKGMTSTPRSIITDVLTDAGFSSMLDGSSFSGYSDAWERGMYITSPTNIADIIDRIAAPLGYWYFNNLGVIRFGLMQDPSTMTPVFYADSTTNIVAYSSGKTKDTKGGVPAKAVTLKWGYNYTINKSPAGATTDARKQLIKEEWSKATKASTNTVYPYAEEMEIETALTKRDITLLPLLHNLHTVPRELVDIEIIRDQFLAVSVILPGQCVAVNLNNRFGITDLHMLVVGTTINYVEESVKLTLWA